MFPSVRHPRTAVRSYPSYPFPRESAPHWRNYRNIPGRKGGMGGLLKVAILGSLTYFIAKKIFQSKSSTDEQN
ncbi:hypothetical protein KCU65_g7859, partial [Aureobasidium melanogenum]